MIKETAHLILEIDPIGLNKLLIKIKHTDSNLLICTITPSLLPTEKKIEFFGNTLGDNITNWPLYQEFIMLLDEAFDYKI